MRGEAPADSPLAKNEQGKLIVNSRIASAMKADMIIQSTTRVIE